MTLKKTFKYAFRWLQLILFLVFCFYSSNIYAEISVVSNDFSIKIKAKTQDSKLTTINDYLTVTQLKVKRIGYIDIIQFTITNSSSSSINLSPINIIIGENIEAAKDPGAGFGATFYDYLDPFIVDSVSKKGKKVVVGPDIQSLELPVKNWFGWANRFHFESIRFPVNSENWQYKLLSKNDSVLNPQNLFLTLESTAGNLQPGNSTTVHFEYLSEAKSRKLLQDENIGLQGLLLINLWDWFRSLCFFIWSLLEKLFMLCGSWGGSIILLALVIRVITIPITKLSLRYQEVAIQQQNKIKPLLQEIKKSYSGVERSEQTIKLYEDLRYDHFAPFKSMLGLFIQIPIFIALFNVIGDAWELSGQSFLWISDLAISDRIVNWNITLPYFGQYLNLLPILMALVSFISTWLASKHSGKDKASAMTLFGMGSVFFVLFYSFPAALVLYWLSSNFFQLLQQLIADRSK